MKKFLLSFVLVFTTFSSLFAQRDTDHWIAPYFDSSSSGYNQALYFSTDSVAPFEVKIYSNNIEIGSVTIALNDPKVFHIPATITPANPALPGNVIKVIADAEAFTVLNKGIYTKGAKPYFLTMRMYVSSHGEILTSKGKSGIGKTFYAASAPITNTTLTSYNFTTGIMATEDNTVVTVSGFNPGVVFINQPTTVTAPITFTLNKGQSYLLAGEANVAANATGFIGAKIIADKPISVTNGNSNGYYATNATGTDGSDLILDQSVPIDRLGKEFAMIRTLASLNTGDNMEGGIIIATENNTEIFLNNNPIAVATLNEGEFYRILDSGYTLQGTAGHYNIYVRATKNVYLYQLVSGNQANAKNNGGYNYIPPLNCFLPRKIEQIGKISEMPLTATTSGQPTNNFLLKLNIITEAGATVLVNNNPPTAAEGPYPLLGNTNWVTYAISGVSDNLTIQSTKAVTAGVNGGYSSAGYGGYFAGFSSVPVISKKTGECAPGIILEVDDGYDSYQWYLNGVAIPGATSNTYAPLVGGNYTVIVGMGTCAPITTPIYKVYSCVKNTTANLNACATKIITPAFTSSPQAPVPSTVIIITQPTHGTAVVNPATGTITYTPVTGYIGTDVIVYKFCGNGGEFVDCEIVTLTLTVVPFIVKDARLEACQYDDKAFFDLTTANVIDFTQVTKRYYPTLADLNANTNQIIDITNYGSAGGFVYVKITSNEGCTANAKIELIAKPIKKSPILVDKYICIDAKTNLEAGPGYDSYLWNTGATTSGIQGVGVGEYTVVLGKNGCFLTQVVRVKKTVDPVITQIEISNTTATVHVNGGTPPYKYSVDGITNWQDSNVFTDLSRGQHTFYVKDTYNCTPTSVEVTVPNLINAITPNGDNKNDYIDYSELSYKLNLTFVIYDRYGNKIFTGDKFNNYRWDGKHFDKKIQTGTYWYHINWNEPNKQQTPIKYTGWILVKNRE
ncbi:gliding motility-associated C-terminal domain-containing protein [Chryseobacterium sp. ERMR1:04]|uniref:T9SS type B sorting domain-containing protein n=1 Tax=Chryseobacterium sp. ERMR1:04 TaxID=1705393 RepID=UPI0006C8717B|nr:gliding motility-associated C-terminal domain-containing protein [Chryseobacterium sp. ERMR1:04]KPH13202.1 gliding motility protein [Chryseobacterium sp. ERMR1:04]